MTRILIEEQTGADIQTTFNVLSDISCAHRYVDHIDHIDMLSDGGVGVGTRWRLTHQTPVVPITVEMTVTEFDPPYRLVAEAESLGLHWRLEYRLTALAESGTRVILTCETHPTSTMGRIVDPLAHLAARPTQATLERDLRDMLAEAERRMLAIEAVEPGSAEPLYRPPISTDADVIIPGPRLAQR